jgi:hypothetical protein
MVQYVRGLSASPFVGANMTEPAPTTREAQESPRKVGALLIVGIALIPLIFTWFLLRKGYSSQARVVGVVWLTIVTLFAFGPSKLTAPETPPAPAVAKAANPPAAIPTTSAPAQPPKPAEKQLAKDSAVFAQMEKRYLENEKSLKKFYGTPSQLELAGKDGLSLVMLKVDYDQNGKTTEEKAFGKKAAALLSKVEVQRRQIYASVVEENFVRNGMDLKATASGQNKNQLRIVYVLMSQPMVYKFQNDAKIPEQAVRLGFTKVVYTNGFESDMGKTWTVSLKD